MGALWLIPPACLSVEHRLCPPPGPLCVDLRENGRNWMAAWLLCSLGGGWRCGSPRPGRVLLSLPPTTPHMLRFLVAHASRTRGRLG